MSLSPLVEALNWRVCKVCGEKKKLEAYHPANRSEYGRRLTCAVCEMAGSYERRVNALEEAAKKYGPPSYRRVELAGRPRPEVCEICSRPPGKRGMQFDHDHVTGQFRGWICANCNVALGLVNDDAGILALMIEYLQNGGTVVRKAA